MLNKVIMLGRMTKTPELKATQSGVSVVRFGIANDRSSTENKTTDFFDVVAWRKTAEFISKYFDKGDSILICGRMETNEFTDRDGVQRKTVQIVAESADFAGKRSGAGNSSNNPQNANNGNSEANNGIDENLPFPLDF